MTEDEIKALDIEVEDAVRMLRYNGLDKEAELMNRLKTELIIAKIRANTFEKALCAVEGK